MTVKELSKLYYLNREIELNIRQLDRLTAEVSDDESLLRELVARATSAAAPPITDMPKAHNAGSPVENAVLGVEQVRDNIRRKRDAILEIKAIISTRQTLCLLERKRLENYIDSIDDAFLRNVFTLRFVNGLPWEQVALSIGGGNKAESMRRNCYRYLKQRKEA